MSRAKQANVVSITHLRQSCRSCTLRELCLPFGLGADDIAKLELIVHHRGPLRAGEHLFREGDVFNALYVVKAGALKTYTVDNQGREHVLGFHLGGELAGLDGIHTARHRCNAIALQSASVCALPFSRLEQLAQEVAGLQTQILRVMSRELTASAQLATEHTAEERLASFLLSLSRRFSRRGLVPHLITLPMPRRDIASHLRLATETVSRLLARFQDECILAVHRREIEILDFDALGRIGGNLDLDGSGTTRGSPLQR